MTIDAAQAQDRTPDPFRTFRGLRCRIQRNYAHSDMEVHSICTIVSRQLVTKIMTNRAWLRRVSHEFSVSFYELSVRWEWWNGVVWQRFDLELLHKDSSWRRHRPEWYQGAVHANAD